MQKNKVLSVQEFPNILKITEFFYYKIMEASLKINERFSNKIWKKDLSRLESSST